MPAPPIIHRVVSLKELGVFRNYTAAADLPAFRRHHLIYGFNGSGKTTLARVFASLEAGAVRPELPEGGSFEVELTDGTVIKSDGPLDGLMGRLLVFDVDFIEQNLHWKEGTANPVFYLGKAQAELAKTLEETEVALTTLGSKRASASGDRDRREKSFTEHKRSAARLIADNLGLGRKYEAPNLATDYAKGPYDDSGRLLESERPSNCGGSSTRTRPCRNSLSSRRRSSMRPRRFVISVPFSLRPWALWLSRISGSTRRC